MRAADASSLSTSLSLLHAAFKVQPHPHALTLHPFINRIMKSGVTETSEANTFTVASTSTTQAFAQSMVLTLTLQAHPAMDAAVWMACLLLRLRAIKAVKQLMPLMRFSHKQRVA
jgi:hypothetical protein